LNCGKVDLEVLGWFATINLVKYNMLKIAHRGASGHATENTKEAFEKALYLDTEVVEFDVRQTKDKKLIVFHDKSLKQKTNYRGWVNKLSLKQIKKITYKNGDLILTLSEALGFLKNKCACKIDVKEKGLEEKINKAIKRFSMEKQAIVVTEIPSVARKFKEVNPLLKVALGGFKKQMTPETIIRKAKRAKVDMISVHHSLITKDLVRVSHKNGLFLDAWGTNDESEIKRLKNLGVDAITTDYPEKI